jgi:bacterioferritin-associated ferredoxin
MIVCHCNVISQGDIERTIDELLAEDPWRVLTPGLVYMTMGKRGRCCGCFPNAIEVISRYVAACRDRDELGGRRRRELPAAPAPERREAPTRRAG